MIRRLPPRVVPWEDFHATTLDLSTRLVARVFGCRSWPSGFSTSLLERPLQIAAYRDVALLLTKFGDDPFHVWQNVLIKFLQSGAEVI